MISDYEYYVDISIAYLAYTIFFHMLYKLNVWRLSLMKDTLEVAQQNAAYINSFINAITVTIFSGAVIYELYHKIWDSDAWSSNMPFYLTFTLAYFVYDLKHIFTSPMRNKLQQGAYIFHHIAFSVVIIWVIIKNKYHGLSAILGITEFSTIFIDVFHYAKYYTIYYANKGDKEMTEKFNHLTYKVFNIFAISFFVVRILGISLVVLFYCINFIEREPMINWTFGAMMFLNCSWMYMIYQMIKNFKFIEAKENKKVE